MSRWSIRKLTMAGLMAALVLVSTMLIQIPTPTRGYIHIGDTMVYLSGILLGPLAGSAAAAIGSLLADLFSGFGIYAPATFVIKGLDALVVGYIYHKMVSGEASVSRKIFCFVVAILLGGAIMVSGYLAYESVLYGFKVAVVGILANITQAIGGGVLAIPLFLALDRIKLYDRLKENHQQAK